MSAFCEPPTTTSTPHASVSSGTAPRLEIASTTSSASFPTAREIASTSATTPVEVSLCVVNTAVAPPSASADATSVGLRRLAPLVAQVDDLAAVRLGDRGPALAEVPERDDEHAVAGRAGVRDGALHRPGSGGGEDEHLAARAVHLGEPVEHPREHEAEVLRAVMDERARQRRHHLGRQRCGARCEESRRAAHREAEVTRAVRCGSAALRGVPRGLGGANPAAEAAADGRAYFLTFQE